MVKTHELVSGGIGFAMSKWLRNGASLKAHFNLRNARSATRVHSHLSCSGVLDVSAFLSRSDISVVIFAYFLIHCWWKFENPSSTCMTRKDSEVGKSLIVDLWSNSLPIPSGLMTNPNKPTSETLEWHFSA